MPDREQFTDLIFPLHGISLLQGFGMQTPGTTPLGLNVRTFEVLTQRGRGGSRPGLAKYIPAQLPNGPHKVQMLNVVVDPQGGALGDIDDGDFPDPSDAGPRRLWGIYFTRSPRRLIRRGGHGYLTWKNRKTKQPIMLVQTNAAPSPNLGGNTTQTLNFIDQVSMGNLLIVVALNITMVTDTLGNTYRILKNTNNNGFLAFALSSASGPCTVTATAVPAMQNGMTLLEYSGVSMSSPFDRQAQNFGNLHDTMWTTTPVPVSNPGELVLGIFGTDLTHNSSSFVQDADFTLLTSTNTDLGMDASPPHAELFSQVYVAHFIGANAALAITGTASNVSDLRGYFAYGASFKPA